MEFARKVLTESIIYKFFLLLPFCLLTSRELEKTTPGKASQFSRRWLYLTFSTTWPCLTQPTNSIFSFRVLNICATSVWTRRAGAKPRAPRSLETRRDSRRFRPDRRRSLRGRQQWLWGGVGGDALLGVYNSISAVWPPSFFMLH